VNVDYVDVVINTSPQAVNADVTRLQLLAKAYHRGIVMNPKCQDCGEITLYHHSERNEGGGHIEICIYYECPNCAKKG
jgi:hypothetical protein